jgi:hypothetical protein
MMKHFKFICLTLLVVFSINSSYAQKGKTKEKTGIGAKYDYMGPFYEGLARVKLEKKWGFIDTTGNVVVKPKYNEVENFKEGLAKVRTGTKWGLVDKSGNEVIKPTFDAIYEFINGKARVLLNGEEYYMNQQGQRVDK